MSLYLQIVISQAGETLDLELGSETTVGRSAHNKLQIREDYVSKSHARISQNEGHFFVEDLNSKNGTFLNDKKVNSNQMIANGDILRFGLAACRVVEMGSESKNTHHPYAEFHSYQPQKKLLKTRASHSKSKERKTSSARRYHPVSTKSPARQRIRY